MPDKDLLKVKLSEASAPLYAVLDGAKFDDLPSLLFDHDFKHKPLYLDMGSEGREVAKTAPQFVRFDRWDYWENNLTPAQRIEALLDEVIDAPSAAVFWVYSGEPKTLFRHLRTINNVMIPRDADTPPMPDPLDPEGETHGNTATHQQVLFRHADANVIAQVIPELGLHRLPRFFGPASAVIAAPDAEWGMGEEVMMFNNPGGPYNAKHRMALSERTMERIEARRVEVLRFNVMIAMKDALPEKTANIDQGRLYRMVEKSQLAAADIGITSALGVELWTYFALKTQGKSLTHPKVQKHFQYSVKPDQTMIDLGQKIAELNHVDIDEVV